MGLGLFVGLMALVLIVIVRNFQGNTPFAKWDKPVEKKVNDRLATAALDELSAQAQEDGDYDNGGSSAD